LRRREFNVLTGKNGLLTVAYGAAGLLDLKYPTAILLIDQEALSRRLFYLLRNSKK